MFLPISPTPPKKDIFNPGAVLGPANFLAGAVFGRDLDLDALISMHKEINKLKTSSQALAEEKNKLSNSIKSASPEERPSIIEKSKALGEEFKVLQEQLNVKQADFDLMMLKMPNMPSRNEQ